MKDFKDWLNKNTNYTKETKSDIVSRLKRANNILPLHSDPIYLYQISLEDDFNTLTVSVKSQIRRAVKLYQKYLHLREEEKYDREEKN